MKRTIYILLLAVFGILSATAENNFIEKFANQKGVTYVNISKALLNMMPEGSNRRRRIKSKSCYQRVRPNSNLNLRGQ